MGSINWLSFSLSSQELLPPPQPTSNNNHQEDHSQSTTLGFNSDEISTNDISATDCFDLTSHDSTPPSLNLPPHFSIFEAFNRNNQPQDWNMKGMGGNTSDMSMLMGTSSSCNDENQNQPKLENFLGRHSFTDQEHGTVYNTASHHDYMFPNCSLQPPSEPEGTTNGGGGSANNMNNGSNIGLSMIKTWLRNHPTPPAQVASESIDGSTKNAQTLSLSMRTGGGGASGGAGGGNSSSSDKKQLAKASTNGPVDSQSGDIENGARKCIDTFGQRTSIYRGVTRHRWTGRYEAHLWDNSCRREGQTRKGRQVYLGGYDKEEKAARAYDLAALKYWGTTTTTNFPISNYDKEVEEMKHMTRQEYVASLRRKSSGFSRGASIYRGVTRHHQHGRWQARIGRVAGNKDLYLGTFSTQEEAAEAYDIAAIKFRGLNAVTNFDMSRYDVKSILESTTLPIGGATKRLKEIDQMAVIDAQRTVEDHDNMSSHLTDSITSSYNHAAGWPTLAFQQSQHPYSNMQHYPYQQQQQQRVWCKEEQDSDHNSNSTPLGFHDLHQFQLGNTHNFFQHNSVLHNLLSMDSTSLEHSSGSNNSIIYNNGVGYGSNYNHVNIPMGTTTVIASDHDQNGMNNNHDEVKAALGFETGLGSGEYAYNNHARNMYYLSQQQSSSSSSSGAVKASVYQDHQAGSMCNNWVPTAVPTLAARPGNMAVCHGAPTFTIWNDT